MTGLPISSAAEAVRRVNSGSAFSCLMQNCNSAQHGHYTQPSTTTLFRVTRVSLTSRRCSSGLAQYDAVVWPSVLGCIN